MGDFLQDAGDAGESQSDGRGGEEEGRGGDWQPGARVREVLLSLLRWSRRHSGKDDMPGTWGRGSEEQVEGCHLKVQEHVMQLVPSQSGFSDLASPAMWYTSKPGIGPTSKRCADGKVPGCDQVASSAVLTFLTWK